LRDTLRMFAATPGAVAQLLPSTFDDKQPAPLTEDFSSRGPAAVARGACVCVGAPLSGIFFFRVPTICWLEVQPTQLLKIALT
jgi:hypothetical protein